MSGDPAAPVRELLAREGIAGAVEVVGKDADIVAVSAEEASLSRLRDLAPEIRALGFRYVTLDLTGHAD